MSRVRTPLFVLVALLVYSNEAFAYTAVFCNNSKAEKIYVSLTNSQAGCPDISKILVGDGSFRDYGDGVTGDARMAGGICVGACFQALDVYDAAGNHVVHDRSAGRCHSVRYTIANTATGGWTFTLDTPDVDFTDWGSNGYDPARSFCEGKIPNRGDVVADQHVAGASVAAGGALLAARAFAPMMAMWTNRRRNRSLGLPESRQ